MFGQSKCNADRIQQAIHQGDVIRSFEGKPIASVGSLQRALGPASVGATLTLGLNRGGEAKTVKLVVGERPSA